MGDTEIEAEHELDRETVRLIGSGQVDDLSPRQQLRVHGVAAWDSALSQTWFSEPQSLDVFIVPRYHSQWRYGMGARAWD